MEMTDKVVCKLANDSYPDKLLDSFSIKVNSDRTGALKTVKSSAVNIVVDRHHDLNAIRIHRFLHQVASDVKKPPGLHRVVISRVSCVFVFIGCKPFRRGC